MAARPLSLIALLAPCALASNPPNVAGETPRTLYTHFAYTATVPSAPSDAKEIDLWLPIPSNSAYQRISNLKIDSPTGFKINAESKYGNRMVFVKANAAPMKVTVSFDVERKEINLIDTHGLRATPRELQVNVAPDAKVPVGGKWSDMARSISGDKASTIEKMRSFFDNVVATMQYDYKKESPHLGEGDVAFVCDYKKGNCSDLHSYISSLARSEGIPSYIEYGFPLTGVPVPSPVPTEGKIGGYHCWLWFYDAGNGWLPLDASDGRRWLDAGKPDMEQKLVGSLVLERSAVAFSKGRDITLNPKQKGPALNNFIYPYAEADGKAVDAKWELTYKIVAR